MVATPTKPNTTQQIIGEKRVSLYDVTWDGYLQILAALPEGRGSRLTYDQGLLEISMPSEDHEFYLRLIEVFIRILVYELGMKMKTMGSTTMNFERQQRSSEPDCAYYFQNQPTVAGRKVDFAVDPPPDLVVEVDISHTDIDKNRLYASFGVPEFWRYDGRRLRIFVLVDGNYEERQQSPTFPWVTKADLYKFLAQAQQDEMAAERTFRAYIQTQIKPGQVD
ncbi:MAG: Uma2 family endonuclease [Synechocystis sp.]|nr:Uma2 family endonuclease [Synechocystis sp.]